LNYWESPAPFIIQSLANIVKYFLKFKKEEAAFYRQPLNIFN